jgi:hypothetical protein
MSDEFLKKYPNGATKKQMRNWCKRPGKTNKDGTPMYTTEQHHKKECDINEIIRKYDKTGLIMHVSKFEAKFGDMTANDFKTMQDKITNAVNMFEDLPSHIRSRFDNHPAELLRFMEDPNNRQEAIELGIISGDWTAETDGLGEHVQEGQNVDKPETPVEPA